ncbi:MAG TPA: Kiwa anti-phage protein KwaB-like domain-containing protein [Verrucomicrobiae bacterium]|nr:Kiwa anti-phage protein KwaB-like domain-containing protein [Verrucomicrobiae bacterium]
MDEPQLTDIFLWANTTDAIKNELDVEFFLFNKNYTPYLAGFSAELNAQIKPLFLFELMNFVNKGAGMGLSVRDFELSEAEENVLLRTKLDKVGRAETLLHTIEHSRHEIVPFSEQDHEFKRLKGVVARFSHKEKGHFYVIKQLQQSQILKGAVSWEFIDGSFRPFAADAGLKMPPDNQVLVVGSDIFVFSQSKFERLFDYDYKKQALAEKKAKEITAHFSLSFPEGMDLQSLVRERKKTVTKLQKINPTLIKQEQLIDHAEEMGLELMVDDAGAIIIMDGNDLDTFVNLLNDDYITSDVTGIRYEVKSKKPLDEAAEDESSPAPGSL